MCGQHELWVMKRGKQDSAGVALPRTESAVPGFSPLRQLGCAARRALGVWWVGDRSAPVRLAACSRRTGAATCGWWAGTSQ